jgi:hypothetical protein
MMSVVDPSVIVFSSFEITPVAYYYSHSTISKHHLSWKTEQKKSVRHLDLYSARRRSEGTRGQLLLSDLSAGASKRGNGVHQFLIPIFSLA